MKAQAILYRVVIHGLLAIFIANAANKFFIADLEYEAANGFYEKIFAFHGEAPDQYRILPLLGIKTIMSMGGLAFNHAVLLFNLVCSFLLFELFWQLLSGVSRQKKYLFNFLYALIFIYLQYTGWRPDTQGLVLICASLCWWVKGYGREKMAWVLTALLLGFLALARAEIALIFAIYLAWYESKNWLHRAVWVAIPIGIQLALQFWIFADAEYYTKPIMLKDNLSLYYFLRNPASYAIAAAVLIRFPQLKKEISRLWNEVPLLLLLALAYLALILVVGRINEYRLYLPFVPLYMLSLHRGRRENGEKISSI